MIKGPESFWWLRLLEGAGIIRVGRVFFEFGNLDELIPLMLLTMGSELGASGRSSLSGKFYNISNNQFMFQCDCQSIVTRGCLALLFGNSCIQYATDLNAEAYQ